MKAENLTIILGILCLLMGGLIGAVAFPNDKIIEKEVEVKVPEVHYEFINQTIEVEKEVYYNYLDEAVDEFLNAVKDEEDEAGNEIDILGKYDFDEVDVKKIYDDYCIVYQDDDEYFVKFTIKLKFDEDDSESEIETFDVKVIYEEDEDTIVRLI